MKFFLSLILLVSLKLCTGGRILYLVPVPSKSHYILSERLVDELAKRGHEVIVVASFRRLKPLENVNEIVVPDINESLINKTLTNTIEGKFQIRNKIPSLYLSFEGTEALIEKTMTHQPVQDLLNSTEKFDLVVGHCASIEGLLAGFAYKLKAPMVAVSTVMPSTTVNELVGNPAPSSYIPDGGLGFTDDMTFYQRVINFLHTTTSQIMYYLHHLPQQNKLMKKYFGKDIPPLKELLLNNSLVLVNHHHSLGFPRPYLPNMIEIGGYHIKPTKPLPQDLQRFMDDGEHGVIYINLGSSLPSSEFPKEKFDEILKALSTVKQRVLWKFEEENLTDLPENVRISKWMPQSDILVHPNLKLFITHGGLLSITESIYRGVPMVGISIFSDQTININQIENLQVGIKLEFENISNATMSSAIEEVLTNPKYTENAKFRSQILQDRPLPPIDTAIYWLEYVMRYKGAGHLRSKAQDLSWYQLYQLDVLAVLGVFIVFGVLVMSKLSSLGLKILRRVKNEGVSFFKKNN